MTDPGQGASLRERTSFRRLGRDTLIYGAGMMLNRAVSFLMLPVYTRYLSTADYGVLQLLDMTVDISHILFTAGMIAGVSLFYFQTQDSDERADILRTAFVGEMVLTVIGATALFLLAPTVWRHALGGAGEALFVRIIAVNFTLQMLTSVPMVLLQLQQRSRAIITINFCRLVAQVSLNILFVVVLHQGVKGILLASFIVNGIQGTVSAVWLIRSVGGKVRWAIVRQLRRFGIPYQLSTAGAFILSFGDRYFLQASRGAAAVGLYGLAYQFGFLLHQLSTEQILKAWNPQRLQLLHEPRERRDARYARGFEYYNLVLITMATGIGLFVRPVIQLMTTAPFHPAAEIVPIILMAYVLQGWGSVTQFGIAVSRQTRYLSYASWIAVAVVLVLYSTLIPLWGAPGAALATVGAFLVRFLLQYRWSQKLWPVDYGWPRNLRLAGDGAGAVALTYVIPVETVVGRIAVGLALLAAYAALVWTTLLGADDRLRIARAVRSPGSLAGLFRNQAADGAVP